jgi:hypothetical protein
MAAKRPGRMLSAQSLTTDETDSRGTHKKHDPDDRKPNQALEREPDNGGNQPENQQHDDQRDHDEPPVAAERSPASS